MDEPKTAPQAEEYDIYLCTRELPDKLTPETAALRQLCSALVGGGYKVFFPSALPRDLTDEQRAERMVQALQSSRVMVAAGVGPEGLADPVARKLWSAFRQAIQNDPDRHFLACFRDVQSDALPEELADAEPLDMSGMEFLVSLKDRLAPLFPVPTDPFAPQEEDEAAPESAGEGPAGEAPAGEPAVETPAEDPETPIETPAEGADAPAPAPGKKPFPWKWVALAAAVILVLVLWRLLRH